MQACWEETKAKRVYGQLAITTFPLVDDAPCR